MSVIIPTFNRREMVQQAVASVPSDEVDVEILVVDDGSTDGTGDALGGAREPAVRYLRQERRGRSAARNLGTRASTGELVVYLDSDDLLLPGGLRIRRDVLDADPGIDVVYGDGFYCDEAGAVLERVARRWPPVDAGRMLETLVLHNIIAAPHLAMVRRASLERLGEPVFDESLYGMEDADLWVRLAARGCRFAGVPDAVGKYRLHGGNESSPLAPGRARREESVRRYRRKVVEADYFGRLPVAVRRECLRQHLLGMERGRPEEQEGALAARPFLDLPPEERARLLYLVGTEDIVTGGDASQGRRRLLAAARLSPRSAKYRAAVLMSRLSPQALGAVLRLRRGLGERMRGPDASLAPHWTGRRNA